MQTEKRCPHCGITKPVSSFYMMKNGNLDSWCKQCQSKRGAKDWSNGLLTRRKTSDEARAFWREAQKRHRKKYPEKNRARQAISQRILRGKIIPPDRCQRCQAIGKVVAHHADYSKPLDVIWLCRPCHRKEHRTKPLERMSCSSGVRAFTAGLSERGL